jgi:hypothetical protein
LITIRVAGQDREFYEDILANKAAPRFEPSGMPVQLRDPGPLRVKRS